ncbi:MAG: YebC/PmpR family DNA-binding transcriptional regulator [Candidatus Komeilibacteria bacterium]
MSGHSKWATTKRQKAVTDAKRSNLFTKLAKNIAVAARDGADPAMNFKLRIAIDKAKEYSMPKDNIERAIARGSGTGGGQAVETILYEAYGPEGIALLIETVTDNKNRSAGTVKAILSKNGGSLGSAGSVQWQFNLQGILTLKISKLTDEQELQLIDAGAEDFIELGDLLQIISAPENLEKIKHQVQALNLPLTDAALEYRPKDLITPKDPERIIHLLELLEDDEDINNVYTNANV